jgi:mono/diheme cytochrome c family protein
MLKMKNRAPRMADAQKLILAMIPFIFSLAFFSLTAQAAEDPLSVTINGKESSFTLAELRKEIKVVNVSIEDPVYGKNKSYDGFPLNDVLTLAGLARDAKGDEVVFTAKDGYAPNVSFSELKAHRAILTFQEHGQQKRFSRIRQGKAMLDPGPYYVVWEEGKELGDKVPWPYQLAKIEVVDFAKRYDKIFPAEKDAASSVRKGFVTFKNQCIRCHSLNLQGGEVGPELNSPKNVTEYWEKTTLRAFIRDASSFRFKDKMPSFPHLKDSDLDDILEYLAYMKDHKIAKP